MRYLVQLFQTLSAFLVLFYLYCASPAFLPPGPERPRLREALRLYLVFSLIAILGNYLGTPVVHGGAILNARAMGSILAGLLGGPLLGVLVGITAGVHRLGLGGIAAFSGAVATTLEGLLAGLVHLRLRERPELLLTKRVAYATTLAGEILHMGIVLLLTRPFPEAAAIVRVIGPPMVLINPVGAALLMAVLRHRRQELDRVAAASSAAALRVAERALGLLPRGFSAEAAGSMASIVREETGVGAVAVTDTERILGFTGLGADHHLPGDALLSGASHRAIRERRVVFLDGEREAYRCPLTDRCPLHSALVVPLEVDGAVVGTVQLFEPRNRRFRTLNRRLGEGIGALLSSQLLLAKYEEQKTLLLRSEVRLLRAQINPHFLFNALTTIMAVIRTNPARGRELVGHLAELFRKNLKQNNEFSTLGEELEHVKAYLQIEMARFQGLEVDLDVDPALLQARLPTFTLQPLVENAVKHGVASLPSATIVRIRASAEGGILRVDVEDEAGAFPAAPGGDGLGLEIVGRRLENLLGKGAGLEIHCDPGRLTRLRVLAPFPG